MWAKLKDWLIQGAIPDDQRLETDLAGVGFRHNNRDQLVLESKEDMAKRGLASPDDADALALTFARSVAPVEVVKKQTYYRPQWSYGYAPFA